MPSGMFRKKRSTMGRKIAISIALFIAVFTGVFYLAGGTRREIARAVEFRTLKITRQGDTRTFTAADAPVALKFGDIIDAGDGPVIIETINGDRVDFTPEGTPLQLDGDPKSMVWRFKVGNFNGAFAKPATRIHAGPLVLRPAAESSMRVHVPRDGMETVVLSKLVGGRILIPEILDMQLTHAGALDPESGIRVRFVSDVSGLLVKTEVTKIARPVLLKTLENDQTYKIYDGSVVRIGKSGIEEVVKGPVEPVDPSVSLPGDAPRPSPEPQPDREPTPQPADPEPQDPQPAEPDKGTPDPEPHVPAPADPDPKPDPPAPVPENPDLADPAPQPVEPGPQPATPDPEPPFENPDPQPAPPAVDTDPDPKPQIPDPQPRPPVNVRKPVPVQPVVQVVYGTVTLEREGVVKTLPVGKTVIRNGDLIEVGSRSGARILTPYGVQYVLDENSEFLYQE